LKPLDHQTYLKAKAVGDNSMSEKADLSKTVTLKVRRGLDGMVKPTLVELQFPSCKMIGSDTTVYVRCFSILSSNILLRKNVLRNRVASATSRKRTKHLTHPDNVYYVRNARSPKSREAHGDGASIVVRERESRLHGEGKQVSRTFRRGGTCDA